MIAGDLQRLPLSQCAERAENARMAFAVRNDAHIDIGCSLGFGHRLAPRPRMKLCPAVRPADGLEKPIRRAVGRHCRRANKPEIRQVRLRDRLQPARLR
ncbi:hypothetical protein D3C78_1711070 [compost metagenome]